MIKYLVGPEIFWFAFYGTLWGLNKLGSGRIQWLDGFIETLWFWIPFLVFLSFSFLWIPVAEKKALLWRIWLTGLPLNLFLFEKIMKTYSKTGPGVGTAYLVCAILIMVILLLGTLVVKIVC